MQQKSTFFKLLLILLILSSGFNLNVLGKPNQNKVILQLKWKHQFQFAGYYAAFEKGYYAEAGLDVEIREISEKSPIEEVLEGNANFGIGNVELIAHYFNGSPLVLLSSIFQHSPSIIIVKENSGIYNPHDIIGKRLMAEPDDRGYEILSMLYSEGVKPHQFQLINHTYSINDLLIGNVDALGGYISNEPFFLESFGIPFRIINPRTYGIDFYSDCLFTSRKEVVKNPERVDKFVEATIKGWDYALSHKEEIATLIISKYNPSKSFQQLMFEANSIHKLINPDLVEIGHTNKGRWLRMAEYLYQQGFIETPGNIDGFIYNHHYYYGTVWYKVVGILILTFLLVFSIGYILYTRFYKLVKDRTEHIQQLVSKLEKQNSEISAINSELLKAKATLEDDFLDKSNFFAGLISEHKAPISSLVSLAEQIISPDISLKQRERLYQAIRSNSSMLLNFAKNIINISSTNSPENKLSYKAIVIQALFESFFCEIKENYLHKGVSLKVNFPPKKDTSKVLLDDDKISRVLDILIRNAFKHTITGNVELGFALEESEVLKFWVKDTGKGIVPEKVKQLNYYFENQTQVFSKNIGFGISIIKSLVSKMKGNLWVESIEDAGTCFFVRIPIIPIENMTLKKDTFTKYEDLLPKNLTQKIVDKNILLSDKHPNNYLLMKTLLVGSGCNLIFSETLQNTVDICIGYPKIDLVIMGMNILSNFEIEAIKTIKSENPHIPVIAHVTFGFEHKERYIESGFSDVMQRPTPQLQLLAKIIEHV
jgi:ABC-type nitrate/sulfonate/bicarbonate transport system substrate-binding protein/CheY-like chemotaxis protein/nitrogen-specific signal transduction histidine kinase